MVKLRDFNIVLGSDVLSKAFTAVALLAMIRLLAPAELAAYVFASAAATMAYTAFNNFFNRQLIFDQQFVLHAGAMQFVAVGLVASAYAAVAAVGSFGSTYLVVAGFTFAVSAMIYDFRRSCLQRVEKFTAFSLVEVGRSLIFAASTLAALVLFDTQRAALILSFQAAGFLLMAILIRLPDPGVEQSDRASLGQACRNLASKNNLLLLGFFVLLGVTGQLAPLLYRPLAPTLDYASFGSAFRYYGLLVTIVTAMNAVTMPAIAKINEQGVRGLVGSILLVCAVSMLLALIAIAAGFIVIPLVDGGKYPDAPVEFAILASGVIFGVVLGPIISFYMRMGRVLPLFLTMALSAVISAAIIVFLAPLSKYAAAAAIPVGIATQLVLLAWPLRRHRNIGSLSRPKIGETSE